MLKLKPITERSWFVLSDDSLSTMVGILTESPTGTYSLVGKELKMSFSNKEEMNEKLGVDVFSKIATSIQKTFDIKGYPVHVDNAIETKCSTVKRPTYTKGETGKSIHCAGYYAIKFPTGWFVRFCPKLTTVTQTDSIGPFKTELEARTETTVMFRREQ